jgi:4-hydroxy-tetrahydrodipicolinate reductase
VVFGAAGETLTLRHDMLGPEAFGPGIVAAVRFAARAAGVSHGLAAALGAAAPGLARADAL